VYDASSMEVLEGSEQLIHHKLYNLVGYCHLMTGMLLDHSAEVPLHQLRH
jgi:hypothetical protein